MENDNGVGNGDMVHMTKEYSLEDVWDMVGDGVYRMGVLNMLGAVHRADAANSVNVLHRAEEVEHRIWVSDYDIHMSGRLGVNETV